MNRIEEIKERFNLWKESGPFDAEEAYAAVVDNSPDDIQYLLSKLEIAEKALETANSKLSKIASKDFTNGQLRYEAATIIQEAIKQIRE